MDFIDKYSNTATQESDSTSKPPSQSVPGSNYTVAAFCFELGIIRAIYRNLSVLILANVQCKWKFAKIRISNTSLGYINDLRSYDVNL